MSQWPRFNQNKKIAVHAHFTKVCNMLTTICRGLQNILLYLSYLTMVVNKVINDRCVIRIFKGPTDMREGAAI